MNELYAFWNYDSYPYIVGGVVKEMRDDGMVYIPSFQGWFKPIKLLPREAGEKLHQHLKGLEQNRARALKAFEVHWQNKLQEIFPR
jgi:hypothetical protein